MSSTSTTCIAAINNVAHFAPQGAIEDCGVSVISLGELEWGVAKSQRIEENTKELRRFAQAVTVLEVDAEVAREFGAIRAYLYQQGTPIGPYDLWIAAHARALRLTLVTNNTREFSRVPELTIDTWLGS